MQLVGAFDTIPQQNYQNQVVFDTTRFCVHPSDVVLMGVFVK